MQGLEYIQANARRYSEDKKQAVEEMEEKRIEQEKRELISGEEEIDGDSITSF